MSRLKGFKLIGEVFPQDRSWFTRFSRELEKRGIAHETSGAWRKGMRGKTRLERVFVRAEDFCLAKTVLAAVLTTEHDGSPEAAMFSKCVPSARDVQFFPGGHA